MSSEIKTYDPAEEKWNIGTHLAGCLLVPFFLAVLLYFCRTGIQYFACTLYCLSLFAMYLGSTLYHASANHPARRLILRRFDHAAIYFLISGSYTPLMLLCVGGTAGTVILGISWFIAVTGMTLELLAVKPFKGFSLILYLISGWLCMAVIGDLYRGLSAAGLILLVAGGIVYTAGVAFYVSRKRFAHAVWHFFVMAGATLQYGTMLTLLLNS